jgi:hypothetical protein
VRDKDVTSGENEEDAAWLDLIANYDAPADIEGGSPWPERENLSEPDSEPDNAPIPGASQVTRSPQAPESPQVTGPVPMGEAPPGIRPTAPADPVRDPDQPRPGGRGGPGAPGGRGAPGGAPGGRGGPGRLSGPPMLDGPGELGTPGEPGGPGGPGELGGPAQEPGPGRRNGAGLTPGGAPLPDQATARDQQAERARRAARGPDSQEEHYFPPPPPPLPKLDSLSKGAWVALFGGPAYLLVATAVGWTVPAVAAFLAIGAFVGGFAVLVLRMGDEPRNGSGPDDGAVV